MKTLILTFAILIAACASYAQTEEFMVTVTGGESLELSTDFSHFMMSSTANIRVRFVQPKYNSSGDITGFTALPAGDPSVPNDSGPRPDIGDTTLTVYTSKAENVFNDMPARKLIFTGSAVVTIRGKK